MKTKFILLSFLVLLVNYLSAQTLLFHMSNSEIIQHNVAAIQKIIFTPTQVEVHLENQIDVLEIAEIEYYNYSILTSVNIAVGENIKLSVFPNPVKNQLTLNYQIVKSGTVNIHLFDLQGRRVAKLHSGFHSSGSHNLTADLTALGLSAGAYQCRINQGDENSSKLVLFNP